MGVLWDGTSGVLPRAPHSYLPQAPGGPGVLSKAPKKPSLHCGEPRKEEGVVRRRVEAWKDGWTS